MIKTKTKTVDISNIIIPHAFQSTLPRTDKFSACYDNYRNSKRLDREIVIDSDYVLRDGYIALMIARAVGKEKVKVLQVSEVAEKAKPVEPTEDKSKFKVGQKVKVTDSAQMFPSYKDWFKVNRIDSSISARFTSRGLHENDVAEIVVSAPHESVSAYGMLYAIRKLSGDVYLISERGIEPYAEPSEPEQPKEPIKLYCFKSDTPGEFLTKGKMYDFDSCGTVKFDDGYHSSKYSSAKAFFKRNAGWKNNLVEAVKRPAKVGEYMVALSDSEFHDRPYGELRYKKGDVLKCTKLPDSTPWVNKAVMYDNTVEIIEHFNYLVLPDYIPEKVEPVYYSGKVVCVDNGGIIAALTVGKVYEIKEGFFINDWGNKNPISGIAIKSLEDMNSRKSAKFIEYRGEQS